MQSCLRHLCLSIQGGNTVVNRLYENLLDKLPKEV